MLDWHSHRWKCVIGSKPPDPRLLVLAVENHLHIDPLVETGWVKLAREACRREIAS